MGRAPCGLRGARSLAHRAPRCSLFAARAPFPRKECVRYVIRETHPAWPRAHLSGNARVVARLRENHPPAGPERARVRRRRLGARLTSSRLEILSCDGTRIRALERRKDSRSVSYRVVSNGRRDARYGASVLSARLSSLRLGCSTLACASASAPTAGNEE